MFVDWIAVWLLSIRKSKFEDFKILEKFVVEKFVVWFSFIFFLLLLRLHNTM